MRHLLRLSALILLLALCFACSDNGGQASVPGSEAEPAAALPAAPEPRSAEPDAGADPEAVLRTEPEVVVPQPAAVFFPASTPHVVIDSPADMSVYGSKVTVAGRVSDSEARPGSTRDLKDVTWVIPGSEQGGRVDYREDGTFGFSYSTRGFQGHHFLSVRAQSKANRFFEKVIALLEGGNYPGFEITSPLDGSLYAAEVHVSGRSSVEGGPASMDSLSWTLSGGDRGGQVTVSEQGTFTFSFPTAGLTGEQTLTLRAVNRQGRFAERSLKLRGPVEAVAEVEGVAEAAAKAPVIVLTSPADGSAYGSTVGSSLVVEGYLRPAAVIRSLTYRLSGGGEAAGGRAGELAYNQSTGIFSFELDTEGLSGPQTLELAAVDRDGRPVLAALRLSDGNQGPVIDLTMPENNSFYRTTVSVVGRVGNSLEDPERADKVRSLSCRLLEDPSRQSDIAFDPKTGVFSVDFSAMGFRGRQNLEFIAENSLGRRSLITLSLRDGNLRPVLVIDRPQDLGSYGAWVSVSGTLTEAGGGYMPIEALQSLTYLVASAERFDPDTELRGDISFSGNSRFQFLFPGSRLSGPQKVTVKAQAYNGNSGEAVLVLEKGDSDLPSFRALPGDRQVTLTWDPLPLAAAYSLAYSEAEARAAEKPPLRLDNVSAPLTVRGLENGRLYSFKLSAAASESKEEYTSSSRQSIPLSPRTLMPSVRGEYEKIDVSWPGIPGSRGYELWRGVDDPEDLQKLAGDLSGTVYEDTEVLYGKTYSYAVKPSLPESPLSRSVSAQTMPFPVQKLVANGSNRDVRALAIAAKGSYAFVAAGSQGMCVVDVADPAEPKTVGTLASFDARAVDCAGDYVYLADGEKGLKVIDVSEPSRPQQVGFRITFAAQDVRVRGDFAYVADGEKGLKVIDIREPRYPVRVASLETQDARGVDMRGDRLYLADGDGGLKVVDISDPAQPRLSGAFPLEDVRAVAVGGRYAGLAAGTQGLIILDISDSAYPRAVGRYASPDVLDVAVCGQYLFLADRYEGVTVIDIADPTQPVKFASLKSEGVVGLAVRNEFAYVARESGLQVVSVRIEGKSRQLAAVETRGKAYALALSGDYAYVADHQEGLKVIDVSAPASVSQASLAGFCDTEYAADVAVKDGYAYVADGPRGLKIIDVEAAWDGDPATQPEVAGNFDSEGNARGLSLQDELLFVADGETGLQILDVRQPGHPVWLAEDGGPDARDVLVREQRAFVIGSEGLRALDVSDPAHPRPLGYFATGAGSRLALSGDILYAVTASGLWLLNVSDPAEILPLGFYGTTSAEDLCVEGDYAYLAEGLDGLTVLDIRDPGNLLRVSSCDEVYAVGVAVRDRYAFVADSSGLKVIDILIPPWLKY
jgi:hypothetical protein